MITIVPEAESRTSECGRSRCYDLLRSGRSRI